MKKLFFTIFLVFLSCSNNIDPSKIQDGDIIFHTSKSEQSKAIQLATNSKYSHMGIILKVNNVFYVLEAVQPVKYTPLEEWIKRGDKSHFVIKRLKNSNTILTKEKIEKIKEIGEKFRHKNYDLYFEWSDDKIYCSELVWKIYKRSVDIEIGHLQKLGDLNLTNPTVKKKLKERYGNNIPLNELVISPANMFNSDRLEVVTEN